MTTVSNQNLDIKQILCYESHTPINAVWHLEQVLNMTKEKRLFNWKFVYLKVFLAYGHSKATYHWNAEVRIQAARRYCPPSASRCPDSWCWGWRPPASAGPAPTPAPTCRPGRQRPSAVTWRCPQHPRCCTWTLQVLRRSWSAAATAPPARRAAPATYHRLLSSVIRYTVTLSDSLSH